MSYTYDTNNYYKLLVDAKTKETKKVPLGSVPHLESLKRDVVTGTVYYYLRTDYKETTIRKVVPKRVFSDECEVMNELMGKGMDEAGVLNSLCNFFRTMYAVAVLKRTDADAAKVLGMKEYAVKMSRRQANAWGKERIVRTYFFILGAVNEIKSGKRTPQGALAVVNAELFFGGQENNAG